VDSDTVTVELISANAANEDDKHSEDVADEY
jgi:hypothetical protein